MLLYAIIMFVITGAFGTVATLIYKGKTDLIHDYHQTKVTDKTGYGKAFGKSMAVMAGAPALSGMVALFGESAMIAAVAVLFFGFAIGIYAIVRVQKKYNGGVF